MSVRMSGKHVENGPIVPVLISFALPVLLLQLLQELFNVTDCMVVGHFGGDYALAATGVAGLVLSILINFFVGFSSGISGIASRLFGERDYRELKRTVNVLFRLAVAAGIGLSALVIAAADSVLLLMRCPAEVAPHAALYLRICACGLTAQMIYNVGAAFLRSIGNTRAPLVFYLASVLCNLLLDALLVIVFKRGIAGAVHEHLVVPDPGQHQPLRARRHRRYDALCQAGGRHLPAHLRLWHRHHQLRGTAPRREDDR